MAAPFYQLLSQNFKLYTQIMKKSCQLYHWNISWIWPMLDFPVGSVVKNLPTMWETQVWFLGWEDPLEEEVATHSTILAWRIAWTEELSKLQPRGHKESDTTERLALSLSLLLPPTSSKLPSLFIGTISVTFSLITHSNFSSPTQPSLRPFTFTY